MSEEIERRPNTIYLNETLDGLEPRKILDRLNVDENRLIERILRAGALLKNKYKFLDARNTSLEIYAYGIDYGIGVYHGKRKLEGLTYEEELYLLYREDRWRKIDTARAEFGRESDPVAEIILNGYAMEEEFHEALESGEYVPTKAMKKEAKERNKHNKDKDYVCESYRKLLDEMEEIKKVYLEK